MSRSIRKSRPAPAGAAGRLDWPIEPYYGRLSSVGSVRRLCPVLRQSRRDPNDGLLRRIELARSGSPLHPTQFFPVTLETCGAHPICHPYGWYRDGQHGGQYEGVKAKVAGKGEGPIILAYGDLGHIDPLSRRDFTLIASTTRRWRDAAHSGPLSRHSSHPELCTSPAVKAALSDSIRSPSIPFLRVDQPFCEEGHALALPKFPQQELLPCTHLPSSI